MLYAHGLSTALMAAAILSAIVFVALAIIAAAQLVRHPFGRLLLFGASVLVPVAVASGGLLAGVKSSSETTFCVSCHEMDRYGKSLFVDNPEALSAVHYQKRLISREQTCFACHTDYAMFGDMKAKMNGLLHVWVHYMRTAPEKLELYQPYPNHNCLHCHDDARSYLEVEVHRTHADELHSGERSCLSCHELGHDLDGVKASNFWLAEER
jgi:cytochrome c-type protein NapC